MVKNEIIPESVSNDNLWAFLCLKRQAKIVFDLFPQIGNCVVSFACEEIKLAIDIDPIPLNPACKNVKEKEECLKQLGYMVLFISEKEIQASLLEVQLKVDAAIRKQLDRM